MKQKIYLYPLYGFIGLMALVGAVFVSLLAVEMGKLVLDEPGSSSVKQSMCYNFENGKVEKKLTDFEGLATNAVASYDLQTYKDISFKDKVLHIFERSLGYIFTFVVAFSVLFIIRNNN